MFRRDKDELASQPVRTVTVMVRCGVATARRGDSDVSDSGIIIDAVAAASFVVAMSDRLGGVFASRVRGRTTTTFV